MIFLLIVLTLGIVAFTAAGTSVFVDPTRNFFLFPKTQQQVIAAPHQLLIPKLGIAAVVEHVGLDANNNMDVPKNTDNVAWYQLGTKPGEIGNAVIAGHLDSETDVAVFYDLKTLRKGDTILVTDTNGKTHEFVVTEKAVYNDDKFPLEKVFGKTNKKHLNLITCDGEFSETTQTYSHRIVIYTELKAS